MCLKKLAIMGSLLNVMAYGAGPWSVDANRYMDPRLIRNEEPTEVLTSDSTIIV
jgi:hypothetical protein